MNFGNEFAINTQKVVILIYYRWFVWGKNGQQHWTSSMNVVYVYEEKMNNIIGG